MERVRHMLVHMPSFHRLSWAEQQRLKGWVEGHGIDATYCFFVESGERFATFGVYDVRDGKLKLTPDGGAARRYVRKRSRRPLEPART